MGMEKRLLESFREQLQKQRDETVRSLSRVQKEGSSLGQECPSDTGELSVTSFSREFLFNQSTRRTQLLRNIEAALHRIEQGTFGECADCGDEINARRLEVMPFTAYCRECQENLERKNPTQRQRA